MDTYITINRFLLNKIEQEDICRILDIYMWYIMRHIHIDGLSIWFHRNNVEIPLVNNDGFLWVKTIHVYLKFY